MIKKVSHIVLSLLLMVSTMGMTINMHYCGETLIDIGVFSEAKSCCAVEEPILNKSLGTECTIHDSRNNHCQNETLLLDVLDTYTFNPGNASIHVPSLDILFVNPVKSLITEEDAQQKFIFFPGNTSPPETDEILSLLQTYLI